MMEKAKSGKEGGTCHKCDKDKNHVDSQLDIIIEDTCRYGGIGGMR